MKDVQSIVKMFDNGVSVFDIATLYQISYKMVIQIVYAVKTRRR